MIQVNKAFSSFSVNNIDKAKEFYGQTLGIEFDEEMGGLNLKIGGQKNVYIYPKDNHSPATFTVLNLLVDDLEKSVDQLASQGVKFEIYDEGQLKTNEKGIANEGPGPNIAWFKDPAGNFLSLIEDKK